MKILLANKFFFRNGGSETVFFQERNFLMHLGHQVIDFSMEHPSNFMSPHSRYFVPNVNYRNGHKRGRTAGFLASLGAARSLVHNPVAVRNLSALVSAEGPEIAHLHNIYHQLTPSIIPLLKSAGIPVILTLHDYKLICPSYLMVSEGKVCDRCRGRHFWRAGAKACHEGSRTRSMLLTLEAYWHKVLRSYEGVDRFIAPSEFVAKLVGGGRVDPSKVSVLYNGIDTATYRPSWIDRDYAIYFGRLSEEKGIEVLLQSFRQFLRGGSESVGRREFSLKIVGAGPASERLRKEYPEVEFCGYRTGDELHTLVSQSSFVVIPSLCNENCSMAALEGMAYGKPIIASRIGGLPEQVDEGKTGFLFRPGDVEDLLEKMEALIRNRPQRKEMGSAGREKVVLNYSFEGHCSGLLKVYDEVLNAVRDLDRRG